MVCRWQRKFGVAHMNFGVKGQGQIYLEYVLWLITGTPFYVFTEGVPIWHIGCLCVYMTTTVLGCWYDLRVNSQGQIYLNILLADYVNSYWWSVFIFGTMITFRMFQTADMTLESMIEIKYTYSSICQLLLHISMEVIQILYNDCLWRADDNECFGSPIWPGCKRSM